VAAAAGVTAAVVSRVLNGDEKLRVRQETRERVLEAARTLRYTPNSSARSLRMASSGAICLVVNDVGNPLHEPTLRGAQSSAEESRRVVLLADANEFRRHPDRLRELVDSRRVDGLLMHLSGADSDRSMVSVAAARLPTVVINSKTRGPAGSVTLDDAAAARLATTHLLELGHERIATIAGVAGSDRTRRRQQGVEAALEAHGMTLRPDWLIEGGFDEPGGHAAGKRLLERGERPTAVVVANVMAGVGVLAACAELAVSVPQELSVIALLDTWFCDHTNPPLTVVDLPMREMGASAFELLLQMIEGKPRRSVVLKDPSPTLVVRKSTARPPA
jgi:DNA-binding LacI/PurR family transcriptional regulator